MIRILRINLTGLIVLIIAGCSPDPGLAKYQLTGATMGTRYNITLVAPPNSLPSEVLQQEIATRLEQIEDLASTYRKDSALSSFNANHSTDWIDVSAELCSMVEQALALSQQTHGAFDITVGPLVNLWGFGPDNDSFKPPQQISIDEALAATGYQKLQTRCSVPAIRKERGDLYVDLSGWAKGYAVDRLADLLDSNALNNYLIEIGGELRVKGHNAQRQQWGIAVEKPLDSKRSAQKVIHLSNTSIATSGDYRNYYEYDGKLYSHLIDTRTGRPVAHSLAAVTVVHPSAAYADGMATALLVLGPGAGPELAEEIGIASYFLIRGPDGIEEIKTSNFKK